MVDELSVVEYGEVRVQTTARAEQPNKEVGMGVDSRLQHLENRGSPSLDEFGTRRIPAKLPR